MKTLIPFLQLSFFLFILGCESTSTSIIVEKDSERRITQNMEVMVGDSIVLKPGSKMYLDSGVNIVVYGDVSIQGTEANPAHVLGSDKHGWGVIRAKKNCNKFIIKNAIIENGRIMSYLSHNKFQNVVFKNNQELVWNDAIARFWYGSVLIEDCTVNGINRGEGFLLHNVYAPNIKNCSFRKVPDAIEYIDCKKGQIVNNYFEGMHDDAIDQNSCFNTLIKDNRIFNAKDCGMELGSEKFGSSDSLQVINNLIVGCARGVMVKESSFASIQNNTFVQNKIGVEVKTHKDSSRVSKVELRNSVISEEEKPLVLSDRSIAEINNCISQQVVLNGSNNYKSKVTFENPSERKYKISAIDGTSGIDIETLGYHPN